MYTHAQEAPLNPATHDAAVWIETLHRRFPELLAELAPRNRSPSAPSGAGRSAPGRPSAPLRLHVSDAVRDITDGVVELDEAVHDRLRIGRPRHARVPQRLARIAGLLGEIDAHPDLAGHVRDEARRMVRRCGRALGDPDPVVRVEGRCPWCDSVSLRAFPDRRAVLCVNPGCRCGTEGCPCATDPAHRHLWPEGDTGAPPGTDWPALAAAMDAAAEGARR
ncbi:hypothetical protein [Streptomyces sp. NPDC058953]|uniref:hypothetical protein n=1 Tax=Streptomyces sp. NPDC058953 TaxID=3346676 RepID=UPI00367DE1DB